MWKFYWPTYLVTMRKKFNDLFLSILRLVAMMPVMGGRGRDRESQNFALKLTLSIFLRQICEPHKTWWLSFEKQEKNDISDDETKLKINRPKCYFFKSLDVYHILIEKIFMQDAFFIGTSTSSFKYKMHR